MGETIEREVVWDGFCGMLAVAGDGYCVTKAFFDILELPQKNRVDCLLLCGLWIVVIGQ